MIVKRLTVIVVVFALVIPSVAMAQKEKLSDYLVDGDDWVAFKTDEKVAYLVGPLEGVIAGLSQGIRIAMGTRLPDGEVFDKAYDLYSYMAPAGMKKQLDHYYREKSTRDICVMHAISMILVQMKIKSGTEIK